MRGGQRGVTLRRIILGIIVAVGLSLGAASCSNNGLVCNKAIGTSNSGNPPCANNSGGT